MHCRNPFRVEGLGFRVEGLGHRSHEALPTFEMPGCLKAIEKAPSLFQRTLKALKTPMLSYAILIEDLYNVLLIRVYP